MPESFNLGSIPIQDIESIRVISGPEALAYGPDAQAGVLSISTRSAPRNQAELGLSAGTFNSLAYDAALPSLSLGRLSAGLSGSYFRTDGYLPPVTGGNGQTLPFTDQEHWDLNLNSRLSLGADSLDFSSSYFRHSGSAPSADEVIAAGTGQYDLDGRQDAWGLQAALKERHPLALGVLSTSLDAGDSEVYRQNPIGADPTSGIVEPYLNAYLNGSARLDWKGSLGASLPEARLGLWARRAGLESGLYGSHARHMESLVLGGTWKPAADWSLELGNILEARSDAAAADSPSLRLGWEPLIGLNLHAASGLGSRQPSFDQLYLPKSSFAALPPDLAAQIAESPFAALWSGSKGNPNLGLERSLNCELGGEWALGPLWAGASLFWNRVDGLIQAVLDPDDHFWTYANIEGAVISGLELQLKSEPIWSLAPSVSGTWIKAEDQSGLPIPGRLSRKAVFALAWTPEPSWKLELQARYAERNAVTNQYLTDLGFPVQANGTWEGSLGADFTVSEHLRGFMSGENLLDEKIATLQGIPQPGRRFTAGLKGAF